MVDTILRQTNLTNESEQYLEKREKLRLAEIELMLQREKVAELRRGLPLGAPMKDYEFEEGPDDLDAGDEPVRKTRLHDLVPASNRALIVYQFMYGKKNGRPCPMCTMLIDSLNGVAHHVRQNADLAVVAAADPAALRAHARTRGWNNLRLLSCGTSTFKFDMSSEDSEGRQDSTISVLQRDKDGTVRHFYTAHPSMAKDIKERGLDLLFPAYNLLDITPQGRGNWYATLDYQPVLPNMKR